MASPDKESLYGVADSTMSIIETMETLEGATQCAEDNARSTPDQTFIVWRAVAEFKAGEVPVERTAYRQAASRKAGE